MVRDPRTRPPLPPRTHVPTLARRSSGCPFRGLKDLTEVFELLSNLSPDAHAELPSVLRVIHEMTADIRTNEGYEPCPVFSPSVTGCPFKTLTLRGVPLVHELEAAAWSRLLQQASDPAVDGGVDPLSKQLKDGTKVAHRDAETTHFVREFIKGRVGRPIYQMMVKDLYHVYAALEAAAERCRNDEYFGPMHYPRELSRVPSLEADLAYYYGPEWRSLPDCEPSEAAKAYVARIEHVASTRPALLIAHSYTRYLGDLSGGRVLMRVAVRTMGLDETAGDGVKFYQFAHVPDARAFKKKYRAGLDALRIDAELASALVDEANAAFVHNMHLFRHLDEQMGLADVPLAPNAAKPNECPFAFSGKAASGRDLADISNCPVHPSFYTSRPWLLQGAAVLAALGAAYWAAGAMSEL